MKFKPSLLACAVLSGLVGLTGCNDDTTNIYEGGDTNPALPDIPDGGKPVCPPVGDGDCDDKPNPETPEIDMGVKFSIDGLPDGIGQRLKLSVLRPRVRTHHRVLDKPRVIQDANRRPFCRVGELVIRPKNQVIQHVVDNDVLRSDASLVRIDL